MNSFNIALQIALKLIKSSSYDIGFESTVTVEFTFPPDWLVIKDQLQWIKHCQTCVCSITS